MSSIRIKVGASLDANALSVFQPLNRAAAAARASIEKELNKIPKALAAGPYRANARAAGTEIERIGKAAKDTGAVIGSATADSAKKFKQLAESAQRLTPTLQSVAREAQRELAKIEKAQARAALGLSGGGGGGTSTFGRRVGYWSMRNFSPVTPTLSLASRIGGEVVRGAGIQTDLSSYVSSYISRQSLAQQIANSGYMPGAAGSAGVRQNAGDLVGEASKVGLASGFDPTQALQGLGEFVKKTGDLETGRAIMGDLAKMSNASGTSLEDMVSAAGDVSNALGDIPDKGQRVQDVMRAIAGQGKLGAVEISDMAKQMAALAAAAPQFTGDTSENIGLMGALAQEARQHGGAKSAAQATTSVSSFVNTFSKGARVKEFAAAGIQVTDPKTGKIRNPEEIILETLQKTSGANGKINTVAMGKLFADTRARTAVKGFENIYNDAGGGKKGLVAVEEEFQRLKKATLSQEEVEKANALRMEDADKKAQVFQNQLQAIADHAATRLIPAMERLEPLVLRAADAFANFLNWATSNPGQAIAVALSASIAKAGLEQVLRSGIEKIFSGQAGGTLGSAGMIGALAIAAVTIGEAHIDAFYANQEKERAQTFKTDAEATNAVTGALQSGTITPEELEKLKAAKAAEDASVAKQQKKIADGPDWEEATSAVLGYMGGAFSDKLDKDVQDAQAKRQAEMTRALNQSVEHQRQMVDVLNRIANGGIKVTNGANNGAPPVDHSGRAPAKTPVR